MAGVQPDRRDAPRQHFRTARDDDRGALRAGGRHALAAQRAPRAVVASAKGCHRRRLGGGFSIRCSPVSRCRRSAHYTCLAFSPLRCGRDGTSVSYALLLALLAVLLIDPWAVLATGFWLSFGAVAILFYAGSSRLGPSEHSRWRGVLIQWGEAQWAVTVGGLPLLLLFFQQFSLVSPLANLVAVPW